MKFLSVLIILVSQMALADTAKLVDVSSSRAGGTYTDILTFDREIPAEEYSVDFINETVQINIPGADLNGRKKFKPVKDDLVKSLYTYQVDEDLLRHRIILKSGNEALSFEDRVSIVKSGKKLLVKVINEKVAAKPKAEKSAFKSIISELPPKTKKRVGKKVKEVEPVAKLTMNSDVRPQAIKGATIAKAASSVKTEEISAKNQRSKKFKAESRELDESEIPVLAARSEKKAESSGMYWRLVFSLVLILIVAGALWFGMKRYRHQGLAKNKHNSIKMLTQHYIGPKKSLAIVSVAGESILIGVTDHNISHIKTLSLLEEEVPAITDQNFSDSLAHAEGQAEAQTEYRSERRDDEDADEFSIRGIKDLVSNRLQGMRDL